MIKKKKREQITLYILEWSFEIYIKQKKRDPIMINLGVIDMYVVIEYVVIELIIHRF